MSVYDKFWNEYLQSQKANKPIVDSIVSTFLIKKSSDEIAKSSYSTVGTIDKKRIKYYKTSENIFNRKVHLPQGKNHGIFVMIDLSASMVDVLHNVIQQAINLVNFCQLVHIPFEVYGYTSNPMSVEKPMILHLLTSDMSYKDINNAKLKLWVLSKINSTSNIINMGGTPTIEALYGISKSIQRFKSINQLDIVNFILISDGIHNAVKIENEFIFDNKYTKTRKKVTVTEPVEGGIHSIDILKFLVHEIKTSLNINMLWFNIGTEDELAKMSVLYAVTEKNQIINKNLLKTGVHRIKDFCNFDEAFFVDVKKCFDFGNELAYNAGLGNTKPKKHFGTIIAEAISNKLWVN